MHLSASWWKRAAKAAELVTSADLKEDIRGRLAALSALTAVGPVKARSQVAREIGISEGELSKVLRSDRLIGPELAERLGYRRVVRFERVE